MADTKISKTISKKPKCLRCGSNLNVSCVYHWKQGWWACNVCNVRWEEL